MQESLAAGGSTEIPPTTRGQGKPSRAQAMPVAHLDDPRALQILTTEHWSLLSARSLVYNEAFSRAGMFLAFLSMSFVAIGLAGPAMSFDRSFLSLTSIILFFDLVIGVATLGRLVDARDDDLRAIQGMNRIRHGYVEILPAVAPYLTTSVHDDLAGILATYGGAERRGLTALLHGLTTTPGMVGLIVSLVAAALAAVVVLAAEGPILLSVAVAIPVGLLVFIAGAYFSVRSMVRMKTDLPSRFPTSKE